MAAEEGQQAEPGQVIRPVVVSRGFTLLRMEAVQSVLAYIFSAILALVIVWSFVNTGAEAPNVWTRTMELLDIFVPVITSLLGSAVGFYFGQKLPSP